MSLPTSSTAGEGARTSPLATEAGQNATQRAQAQAIAEVDHVLANARKELDVLLKTSTPTKAIATVLVASYLLFLVMPWTSTYLALVPEKTVPCVWNVLTSGFYEMNLVGTAIDVLGVLYLGRTLEPIWGAGELMHFVLVVQTSVGIASFVSMYLAYVLSSDQFYLFATFSGFHGVLAGLLVAVRQQLPDERVPVPAQIARLTPNELRNRHLPGLYCAGVLAFCVLSGAKHHHVGLFLFSLYGAYASWAYLRWFQLHPARTAVGTGVARQMIKGAETDRWGDDRHDFDFAEQFPSTMRPACRTATDPLHAIFCDPTAGIARRFVPAEAVGARGGAGGTDAAAARSIRRTRRGKGDGGEGRKLLEERPVGRGGERDVTKPRVRSSVDKSFAACISKSLA